MHCRGDIQYNEKKQPFDERRYVQNLLNLPKGPFDYPGASTSSGGNYFSPLLLIG